jgi:hypothetical protein
MRLATLSTIGLFLVTVVLIAQSPLPAEIPSPFGLKMGMTKDQVGNITKELAPYKFELASVSRPHPDLDTYVATITPTSGLCFIRALSPTREVRSDGTELKSRFNDLKSQLEGIYGKPNVTDSLQSGSNLSRDRDWMAALLQNERTLLARWSATEDDLPMKPTIRKVYVGAFAATKTSGYLAVEYYFENYAQCQTEIPAKQ